MPGLQVKAAETISSPEISTPYLGGSPAMASPISPPGLPAAPSISTSRRVCCQWPVLSR